MLFKSWLNKVPAAPGTTPIPSGNVRLYHFFRPYRNNMTDEEMVRSVEHNGIDINKSKGHTYGEPKIVWASAEIPDKGHVFAEFSIPWNDPRWGIGRPHNKQDAERFNHSNWDVTLLDSIKPDEIIAVHLPWHYDYRYLVKNNMIPKVLAGEFDYLLDNPESPEAKAVTYIKGHGK